MIKFTHTADIHFGMENYGKIDPITGIHSRLLDFNKALNFCIDRSIEENVDFFLFCGDAYKTSNPTPTQQKLFFGSLIKLYKANIPVVIIVGNHDNPASFGKVHSLDLFSDLPIDGFYVIPKPSIIKLETKNGPIQIVGIPWPNRNNIAISEKHAEKSYTDITSYISETVGKIINSLAQSLDKTIPAILAGHLTVSTGLFSGSEKRAIYGSDPIFLPSQLAIEPFDYVALGHLHRFQDLNKNGHPSIIYPGSIERIDFGERNEEKGFCIVKINNIQDKNQNPDNNQNLDINTNKKNKLENKQNNIESNNLPKLENNKEQDKKNKTSYEFIKTPTRKFVQIEVKLEQYKDHTTQILNALEKHDINGAIVKILYHVLETEKDKVDLQIIQKACENAMHLVGIIPIRENPARERRSDMKVSMDFQALVGAYLDTRPELKQRKNELLELATTLFEESKINEIQDQ